jgi:hypothetical protein
MKGQNSDNSHLDFPSGNHSGLLGHELGNVLNGLLGMAELLAETELNEEQSQWLIAIEHACLQMQSLIRPERFTDRGMGMNLMPRARQVDGVQMLEQVLTSHIPAAQSRDNVLLMVMAPDLPRYWDCDPCMVRQLLDNVLGNAIKFTESGQVLVEILAGPDKHMIKFRVSDSGPGIGNTRQAPPVVAQPTRVHSQGLGLYICHQLVKVLEGRINCTTPDSGGTCIEILIPGVLLTDTAGHSCPGSGLFDSVRCYLNLGEPLLGCAGNILDRLGVDWTNDSLECSDEILCVGISEISRGLRFGGGALLLSPLPADDSAYGGKAVAIPLLESSIAALLLELVFEWHDRNISCDIPDSAPIRR